MVVDTTVEGSAVVQHLPHDAKDVAVLNTVARSRLSSRRRTVDCGVARPFAVVWDEKTRR